MILLKNKKAQSQVVATVLLILLVIAATVVLMNFAVPFVKTKLSESDCLDTASKIELKNNPKYTCYTTSPASVRVQVHIGEIKDQLKGFVIEIGGASSKTYNIYSPGEGTTSPGVSMYSSLTPNTIELPDNNQERTYAISYQDIPDSLKIYAVLKNGKTCEASKGVNDFEVCQI